MTPSERAALKAEIKFATLSDVEWSLRMLLRDCERARLKACIDAAATAARDRVVAAVDGAPSLPSTAPSSEPPEARREGGDSGGRPLVTRYSQWHRLAQEHWCYWAEHDRLVSWLDADRERKSARIVELETELAMARQEIAGRSRAIDALINGIAERDRRLAELQVAYDRPRDLGASDDAILHKLAKAEALAGTNAELLNNASWALLRTGYFDGREIGPDIAPRITELWSALQSRAEKAEADAAVLRQALLEFENDALTEEQWYQVRVDALATGAGKELLVEVKKLRAFVRADDAYGHAKTSEEATECRMAKTRARAAIDPPSPGHGGQAGGAS